MANLGETATMVPTIRIVEFVAKLDHKLLESLIVKYSDKEDSSSHLQDTEVKLKKNIEGEQHLKLTRKCILKQEIDLDIEIHRKHPLRRRISSLGHYTRDDPLCKATVKFDDLWDHLVSETQEGIKSNFKVEFPNGIRGLHFWIVAEDLSALDGPIKRTMEGLNNFRPILHRLGSANDVGGMFIDIGMAISGLNSIAKSVFSCIDVIYKNFKAQDESYREMKRMAESIGILTSQMHRLKEVPKSDELSLTIRGFPRMVEDVVDFIEQWLKSWSAKYLLASPHKDKAIELRKKLDAFVGNFDRDILLEIRAEQAKDTKAAADKKELDDIVRVLGENRLSLRKSCMEGTRTTILQEIENEIKNVDGPNVIWIRGSPGVGKSALAASIANRLVDQKRRVISFRFDRTESTITTSALWRAVACDLARLYPSLRQHLAQESQGHSSSDIDRLFKSLIEVPLSSLVDAIPHEELPVFVIDALDECGGLRHDTLGKEDFRGLLHTLKRWIQVDHLKKLKLVITSRPEDRITFPDSISIHDIPSGHGVKPGDSASNDIHTFLQSRLDDMKMETAWITETLDYLVPGAAGMFIWATTVANFLEDGPQARFHILKSRKGGEDIEGMDDLFSLYATVVRASFGQISRREVQGIVSVMGAMIYAKLPLSDNVLVMLPGVKIGNSDVMPLIRKGLVSVIGSGPILRFHHKSFEDYLLSPSFLQQLPEFSTVQDRGHHERQLAMLCLKALISPKLHFNMCSLDSSVIKNVDIEADVIATIPPLIQYSSQFWVDHLVHTRSDEPSDQKLKEGVKFVMYEKLLFWIETMSLLGKAYDVYLILKRALAWKSLNLDNELTLFIHDALRFISAFIVPISQSAPHVYLSALPFAPEESHVVRKFGSRFPNTFVVTQGKHNQWPISVFAAEYHNNDDEVLDLAFSPDESTFLSRSYNIVYICDSGTGHCISGPFEIPEYMFGYRCDACFSPAGNHILFTYPCCAVVWDIEMGEEQFRIKGSDFAFVHYGGRIASVDWFNEDRNSGDSGDGNSNNSGDKGVNQILVQFWDASNGTLIPNRLLEVNDVGHARFSPDGHFLAIEKGSWNVIELWNLEDDKDFRRFTYPHAILSFIRFSPTSDTLMVGSGRKPCQIYLWRLDTQEMASFSYYFDEDEDDPPHVIHSTITNYLFIRQPYRVEVWDVSATGSKMIWEMDLTSMRHIDSICPSCDGHKVLVACGDVRMWNVDLENLVMNQADTTDTQDDTDVRLVLTISPSGEMVVTILEPSSKVEFLDTTTGEVVTRMDIECEDSYMEIAFSPDEDQVAFLSESLITICDIMHPEKRVSFHPWLGKVVWSRKVAFQTCNDLVICATSRDSALLQVWHRQDPAGFECTYSLDFRNGSPYVAPDGLTVVIVASSSSSSTTCYSWNHETAQFDPVHFDDQVHISCYIGPKYSPDGKLLACWSFSDSHVRVWDTQFGHLVSSLPFRANRMALSPALIDHSLGERLIALRSEHENAICLFDAYTGHLHAQILGQAYGNMAFIRNGTALAFYEDAFGLRIWDIADLAAEHRQSTHRHELMFQGMTDGWVMGQDNEPLFWVPVERRKHLYAPPFKVVIEGSEISTIVDLSNSRFSRKWTECIDKGWLRELEQKEKEVRNLLGKQGE